MLTSTYQIRLDAYRCLDSIIQQLVSVHGLIARLRTHHAVPQHILAQCAPLEKSAIQAAEDVANKIEHYKARASAEVSYDDANTIMAVQQSIIELQSHSLIILTSLLDSKWHILNLLNLQEIVESIRARTISMLTETREAHFAVEEVSHSPHESKEQPDLSGPADSAHRPLLKSDISPGAASSKTLGRAQSRDSAIDIGTDHRARAKTWTRPEYVISQDDSGAGDSSSSNTEERKRRGLSSFIPFHRHHSNAKPHRTAQAREAVHPRFSLDDTSPRATGTPPIAASEAGSKRLSLQSSHSHFRHPRWGDNLVDVWSSDQPPLTRYDTAIAPDTPQEPVRRHLSGDIVRRSMSVSRANSAISTPTPENDFLGFCKSAWMLQSGDRKSAFTKCREVEAWSRHASPTHNSLHYLACTQSRCQFRSRTGYIDAEFIWRKVFHDRARGIKYRWTFLAKSHISQRNTAKQDFTFQCLFCVLSDSPAKIQVFSGTPSYLDHIAGEHRGMPLSEVLLHRTCCIYDRQADDQEDFDINIFSPIAGAQHTPQFERHLRHLSIGEAVGSSSSDAKSWSANRAQSHNTGISEGESGPDEPWNTGLSEFHYQGDFDELDL